VYFAHAQLLMDEIPPEHYYARNARNMALVVHAESEPAVLASSVREIVRQLDPSVPVSDVRTMTEIRTGAAEDREFLAGLLVVFACIALALATVGVYGVVAFTANRRAFEMGIRMALGAEPSEVRRMVVRHGLQPVFIGAVIGLGGAVVATRLMQSLLYNVRPLDPSTLIAVPVVIVVTALVASFIPAFRASRVDPAQVLRSE
jgi:ABC-type antimicrobial peptide transport system permease subunit